MNSIVCLLEETASKLPQAIALEDSEEEISSQTYLRGELLSYSEETVVRYAQFVRELALAGRSLNEEIIRNTVRRYGYASLEDAEERA